jgi:hypothetical protein
MLDSLRTNPKSKHQIWRESYSSQGEHVIRRVAPIIIPGSDRKYAFAYGNIKLSGTILIWALATPESCPASTPECEAICYGVRGERIYPRSRQTHLRNLELSRNPEFVEDMKMILLSLLAMPGTKMLRIHETGDFYNETYAMKWVELCHFLKDRLPHISPHFYTKAAFVKDLDWPDTVKIWYSIGGTMERAYPPSANLAYILDPNISAEESIENGIYSCPGSLPKGEDEWYVCGRDCHYCFVQENNTGTKVGFPLKK